MDNMATVNKRHNTNILRPETSIKRSHRLQLPKKAPDCPPEGDCMIHSIAYKTTVSAQNRQPQKFRPS